VRAFTKDFPVFPQRKSALLGPQQSAGACCWTEFDAEKHASSNTVAAFFGNLCVILLGVFHRFEGVKPNDIATHRVCPSKESR
jgi:hypothetical protein